MGGSAGVGPARRPPPAYSVAMGRKRDGASAQAASGVVRWFNADEGWGVIDAPEVPGGCFVHFSNIDADGYRELADGQRVRFTCEHLDFLQDGYSYRALTVWPQ